MTSKGLASQLFALLLLVVLIGPNPLGLMGAGAGLDDDGGNPARQALLLILIAALCTIGLQRRGVAALNSIPWIFWPFFGWALFSILWSSVPEVAFRRYVLMVGVTFSILLAVNVLGVDRALKSLKFVVALLLLVDILAVLMFDNAVHGPGEADRALVGLWKGVHSHKNIAASVAFVGVALSFSSWLQHRNKRDLGLMALSVLMIWGTGSKTTLALLPACLMAAYIAKVTLRRRSVRLSVRNLALSMAGGVTIAIAAYAHELYAIITEPSFFTGRGVLWSISFDYVSRNPLGAGFGSFWDAGMNSPLFSYGYYSAAGVPHGHNGYFDTLVTTGYVGLLLAILACVIYPAKLAVEGHRFGGKHYYVFVSFVIYFAVHNMTESSIFSGGRVDWVIFVALLGAQRLSLMTVQSRTLEKGTGPSENRIPAHAA